jgi:hypothetical protein
VPTSKGRSKGKRPGRGGPGGPRSFNRGPSPDRVFADIIRRARPLLDTADPLDPEIWASGLLGLWHDASTGDEDPDLALGLPLVARAERSASRHALALLRALGSMTCSEIAKEARLAGDRLADRGVPEPPWAQTVGRAAFVSAWLMTHPFGDQDVVLLTFQHHGRPAHSFSVLIDHNFDGIVKDIAMTEEPVERLVGRWRSDLDFTVREIGVADAAARVQSSIDAVSFFPEAPSSEDRDEHLVILESRIVALDKDWDVLGEIDLSEKEREALVEEFVTSPEAEGVTDAQEVAGAIVAYRCDAAGDDPLRWSPIVVELLLLDWFPRKVTWPEEQLEPVPNAVRAWVRYAGRKRGLAQHLIDETVEAVGRFEPEFLAATKDPGRFGPAKALVTAMQRDGVDLMSENQVQAWMEAFNRRSEVERRRLLG